MRVIKFDSPGSPDVLYMGDDPIPQPAEGEVLIRVEAAGVSRADILQRQGKYPPPSGASPVLGLDVAGAVEAVSIGVGNWRRGDRVCALVNGGGYAEYCAVPAGQILPVPVGWSALEAATLPENLFTVYDNLVTRARLKRGETVLVHGGTSGIGTTAIMLARALGAVPYATAGSAAKCEASIAAGAEAAIHYREADFVESLKRLTNGTGVDVIIDIVGGSYLERNVEALALEGRIALVATLGGSSGNLPISKLMMKRGTIVSSTLRSRTAVGKAAVATELARHIWPLLPAKKAIRPLVDSTFPLARAAEAHRRMEAGLHIGKIVLTLLT